MSERVTVEPLDPAPARSRPDTLRTGFVLLAAGAVIEAVGRLLYVPWYDEPDRYVNEIVEGRAAHYTGAALSFIAAVLITVALTRIWAARTVHGGIAAPALTLALTFPLGLAGNAAVAFFAGSFGSDSVNVAEAVNIWETGFVAGADFGWYFAMLGGAALAVAAAALARRGALPHPSDPHRARRRHHRGDRPGPHPPRTRRRRPHPGRRSRMCSMGSPGRDTARVKSRNSHPAVTSPLWGGDGDAVVRTTATRADNGYSETRPPPCRRATGWSARRLPR